MRFFLLSMLTLIALAYCLPQFVVSGQNSLQMDSPEVKTLQNASLGSADVPSGSDTFSRAASLKGLSEKQGSHKPLVIHVLVPLCDNENQGIIPVPESLGNGFSPRTNLYWGALYGLKTHFSKHPNWKKITIANPESPEVLERVLFEYQSAERKLLLVADAYKGDAMQACVDDFVGSISGHKKGSMSYQDERLGIYEAADLIVFNGHNGLMDVDSRMLKNTDGRQREGVVIACASQAYFVPYFKQAKAYPVLNTTNLLAPEAYVIQAVAESWGRLESTESIADAAAKAYNEYQKCGYRGARRLFHPGW